MNFGGKESLKDYPEKEKVAYLAAVASMATADDKASAEEEEFLIDLCDEAELTESDKKKVIMEAQNPSHEEFDRYLGFLRNSDLKYSFIVDILTFAKADGQYTEDEKRKVHRVADRLGISIEQYNVLNEYVEKAENAQGEEASEEGFLEKTGLKQKFEKLNIPVKGLLTGLIGSMLIRGVMGRRRRGSLLTSLLGGGGYHRRGGLSSVIGMINGRRGYRRSGSLLSKFL